MGVLDIYGFEIFEVRRLESHPQCSDYSVKTDSGQLHIKGLDPRAACVCVWVPVRSLSLLTMG